MPATQLIEQVRKVAARAAETHGLDIFDVQYRREASGMMLRVQIDRPGSAATAEESVSVEDCARVSRDLSAMLDVEDLLPVAYTLEVSSPGLDRPLRGPHDYRRFTGRHAKIVLKEKVDGQTFFRGRLAGMDEAEAEVQLEGEDGRSHRLPLTLITRANLEVEF
ncbi:MAG TPA: ribosome maturation factor RimP [Vicinamibacterales bacterium]|nr:ribosome maturation factor RimP [Vicinamibacterales bacterium]